MIYIDNLIEKTIEIKNLKDFQVLLDILKKYPEVFTDENEIDINIEEILNKFKDEQIAIEYLKVLLSKGIIVKRYLFQKNRELNKRVEELSNEEDAPTLSQEQKDSIELLKKLSSSIASEFLGVTKFEEKFETFRERLKKLNEEKSLDIPKEPIKTPFESEIKKKVWPLEEIFEDLLRDSKITALIAKNGLDFTKESIIEDIKNALGISKLRKEKIIQLILKTNSAKELISYISNSMLNSSNNLGLERGTTKYNLHRHF